ncbi:MAG: TrbG/VirB9 family P-type conjugative transfer protein [Alphaproteobacteria bacterium]|nr:TrbG/VirB9 family P-type conjugative transfer protein [Alphaproteobacteria bacterium]
MAKIYLKKLILATVAFGAFAVSASAQQPSKTDVNQLNDAVAQTSGEFDTMNLNYIHSLGMQQKAWNDPMQHLGEGQTKPGYSRYMWTPDVVLPVRLREGMMTLINLPPWELIEKVHIGSPESFGGEIAAPNSLLLYADPTYIGVDSNLIIFGRSGNRYVFYLRSETYNTDRITHSVVDVLVGPKNTPSNAGGQLSDNKQGVSMRASSSGLGNSFGSKSGTKTSSNSMMESIPVNPENFRFDIDVYIPNPEDIEIAPERVWRDDIFTYIDLGPKVLTMTQRPIVNMLVQDSEVPVGFRTKGDHGRLIVVEGIGDMVLRNGKRLICLKLRRDPSAGQYVDYSGSKQKEAQSAQNAGSVSMNAGMTLGSSMQKEMSPLRPLPKGVANSPQAASGIVDVMSGISAKGVNPYEMDSAVSDTIAIELGADDQIAKLEALWDRIIRRNEDVLRGYEPYFSVDANANGNGKDFFRLRIGPVKKLEKADSICNRLSKRGVTCSVVKTQ